MVLSYDYLSLFVTVQQLFVTVPHFSSIFVTIQRLFALFAIRYSGFPDTLKPDVLSMGTLQCCGAIFQY